MAVHQEGVNVEVSKARVMIAGIGGASLGTELRKCLEIPGDYEVFGCDISRYAYGLYEEGFKETFVVPENGYVDHVLELCEALRIEFVLPGGERPMVLLGAASERFSARGVCVLGNDPAVVQACSDKNRTSSLLEAADIAVPLHVEPRCVDDIMRVGLPCIVKPATGSGGSASVFFATTADEAMNYADFIRRSGVSPAAQEYLDDREGEFTVGVLSLPNGEIVGSIAMRRFLESKLSVMYRSRGGVISSGYSQGRIDAYPEICAQAERIASALQSKGPLNVQGRVRNGILVPFEINPRFSASTYLRAMAGFNEVDILLRYHRDGAPPARRVVRPGLYLRSLMERHVPLEEVR